MKRTKGLFFEEGKFPTVSLKRPNSSQLRGTRFRKRFDTEQAAAAAHAKLTLATIVGNWDEVEEELTVRVSADEHDYTIPEAFDIYIEDYCKPRRNDLGFKLKQGRVIKRLMAKKRLKQLTVSDITDFDIARSKEVAPATVNRGLAVLKNMLNFFYRKRHWIASNPAEGYQLHKEVPRDRKIMDPDETRTLVEATLTLNEVIGAYMGFLRETGIRREEGLDLEWESIDIRNKRVSVTTSRKGETRQVRLTAYAIELLQGLPRIVGNPYVFVRLDTGRRLSKTTVNKYFRKAKKMTGITKARGYHDLRHYRATEWLRDGVNIKTVKTGLGHSKIQTTEIYLHNIDAQAEEQYAEAEAKELARLKRARKSGDNMETA